MAIIEKDTGKILKSAIEEALDSDLFKIKSSAEFSFDWSKEKKNDVHKIYIIGQEEEILGLMSLIDHPGEYRIHLNLIEVGKQNRGKKKSIENIAGCLIAFACQLAFIKGYLGFISLQPKTRLIPLYQKKYGFRQYGRLLAIEQDASRSLIEKYLEDEDK